MNDDGYGSHLRECMKESMEHPAGEIIPHQQSRWEVLILIIVCFVLALGFGASWLYLTYHLVAKVLR